MNKMKWKKKIKVKKVGDMEYADDIDLLVNNTENAQKELDAHYLKQLRRLDCW